MNLLALLATLIITIVSFPQNNIAGQEFNINFNIAGTIPNSNYYAKALGGENFTKVDTFNSGGWFAQNSAWTNMPSYTSNSEGTVSGTIKAKFDTQISQGSAQFKIRIRKVDDDINVDSDIVNINVSTPAPSAPPSPVPSPTSTPTPRPTPTATSTVQPTSKPTDTPTIIPTITDSPIPMVLGEEEEPKKNNFYMIPLVIISLGIGLIGIASYMAYKIQYNNNRETKI